MGTNKAILEKIAFCHQEDSLWPFEDSSTLKTIFDELFETEKHTQVLETLWELKRACQKKIAMAKKTIPYLHRLYVEDRIRNKKKALTSMIEVDKLARKVGESQIELKKMRKEIDECG